MNDLGIDYYKYGETWRTTHDLYTPRGMESVAACHNCDGFEGSLPIHCPMFPMSSEVRDAVYQQRLEFVNGRWWRREPLTLVLRRTL